MNNYQLRQEMHRKKDKTNRLFMEAIAVATFLQLACYGAIQYERHGEAIRDFARDAYSGIERFLNK